MTDRRDRWTAAGALLVLVVLAGTIALLVRDAQRAGIEALEDLRAEQASHLADSMDTRVRQAYASLAATVGAPGRWTLVPGDPGDRAALTPTNPRATSGALLLDEEGLLLNGSLLRDPDLIGQPYRRDGLTLVLAGEPTVLSVGPGLTTTEPVLGIAIPVRAPDGSLAGAYVSEAEVKPSSPFSEEVAQLRAGDTGTFSFVDAEGRVLASTHESELAEPSELDVAGLGEGFHRVEGTVVAIAPVPSARWHLVFSQSTSEFEGDLTGPLRIALLLVLVVAVLAIGTSVVTLVRRLRSAREEQERLGQISAAREEFTGIVLHELRTPVAGMLGFLQTTLQQWEVLSDPERRQAVARAQANAERLQKLTADVVDASTVEAGDVRLRTEVTDLRSLVAQAVDPVRGMHAHRRFDIEAPDQPVPVDVDVSRLRQVVDSLLDNAIKSSPPEGRITVRVTGGDTATVAVRDEGPGIPAADRERIFQKFTRGRSGVGRGSGLGLYLAREIIGAHGGRIWVADGDPPGATVLFSLPTVDARADQ